MRAPSRDRRSTYTGVGNCIIDANQAGNANYTAAPQVTGTVAVGQGAQTITSTRPPPGKCRAAARPTRRSATGVGRQSCWSSSVDPSPPPACTICRASVTFTEPGNCIVDANQAGNANYTAAPQVQQSVVVGMGTQTIILLAAALGNGRRRCRPVGHRGRVR